MGFLDFFNTQLGFTNADVKSATEPLPFTLPVRSPEAVRADLAADIGTGGIAHIQLSAVFACARVIAEGLAQVPCRLIRDNPDTGGKEKAKSHPLYNILSRRPNTFMNGFEFREWMMMQSALVGNAYALVTRDANGLPRELIPLAAGSVTVSQPDIYSKLYTLNVKGTPTYTQKNIWHMKGPSLDGVLGLGLHQTAQNAIALAFNLERFGSNLFVNGARPSGLLTTDQNLTPDQYQMLIDQWNTQQAGVGNAHKTAVLTGGMSFQAMQTSANDAQFIESRRLQVEEICRIMRVDPVMIMQPSSSASYASIEQRFLAHLTHTLAPWQARFEQSAEANLLSEAELKAGYRVQIDSRSMTMTTAADRAAYLSTMKQNGFMTTNECRDFSGLDRINDPSADLLTPAANLYGDPNAPKEPLE